MGIKEIEEKWLVELFRQCRSYFESVHLPSHDHHHHFRVWYFAKEMIRILSSEGIRFPDSLIEEIIFSAFFHDVGMSVITDEKHGQVSADLFQQFIESGKDQTEARIDDIYNAINSHDHKKYENVTFEKAFGRESILSSILNISDDLDAFGYIGVYRYLEIYLLRRIEPDQLAASILPNLNRRFSNITFTLGKFAGFVDSHQIRYRKTIDFFNDLLYTGYTPDSLLKGPSGIVKMVKQEIIEKKGSLNKIIGSQDTTKQDEYIREFLRHYKQEEAHFTSFCPDL